MTNKAYIVANEQQEREVLKKLEEKGALWQNGEKAVNFIPFRTFPYVIYCNGDKFISWDKLYDLDVDKIIVFDGRKEEYMSEKYVVSHEFMNELKEWKDTLDSNDYEYKPLVGWVNLKNLPETVSMWWGDDEVPDEENNNRLIAILRWVNGEDVFKVEKPKKWVVRSKVKNEFGYFGYVALSTFNIAHNSFDIGQATTFDTKEEAESWANSHQEVIQVEVYE
ncbi:hypothetical protein [Weissella paramesenteroides]|uniref:hypothetical protein n=1 Tax=Weissella paramesenteroides TaxID=1249 RepID=UPI00123B44C8|nr:hypothetical protein [Weissella paramesenteroides]KAA8455261.1 hypothetical protein FKV86_08160 [Weissella paramesenteroides]KAA8456278.1 hypothetical protein FKV78_08365 [Weissella paramesenteroides]KAA8458231.1 hypothetical protein FKV82_07320 [Weissella paramesenteroides]KAA8460222.1 hypothetical protein FKV80_09050 [Weissella paramesenteroides]KAA8461564.1 hypothetical protein FKV85_08030 [Weissella paramesenteroides]